MNLFFHHDTAATEIYTLSLHDALPISENSTGRVATTSAGMTNGSSLDRKCCTATDEGTRMARSRASSWLCPTWASDRKSTRLNSSHVKISYAVFCLKKKKK